MEIPTLVVEKRREALVITADPRTSSASSSTGNVQASQNKNLKK